MNDIVIPDRYRYAVIPHIIVRDAAQAIEFYKRAFDAKETFRLCSPHGGILHAEIVVGRSVLMLGDATEGFSDPLTLAGISISLHVYVDEVDSWFERAVSAGAYVIQPPTDMFYGDRTTMLKDPFGFVWVLLTHKEDLNAQQVLERAARTSF
jgi:PhnB protein